MQIHKKIADRNQAHTKVTLDGTLGYIRVEHALKSPHSLVFSEFLVYRRYFIQVTSYHNFRLKLKQKEVG